MPQSLAKVYIHAVFATEDCVPRASPGLAEATFQVGESLRRFRERLGEGFPEAENDSALLVGR